MKKQLLTALQFLIAAGLITLLLRQINTGTLRVTLATEPVTVSAGSIYTNAVWPGRMFTVLSDAADTATVELRTSPAQEPLPASGSLLRAAGQGAEQVNWATVTSEPYGLNLLGRAIREAGRRWPLLVAALAVFFLCMLAVTQRWRMLLSAQGLKVPFPRAISLYLIGHFFNSFLPGATSGDLIKVFYVARATPEKKTEAATTIFLDRILGLLALVWVAVLVMLLRLPFFLEHTATRWALLFMGALFVGSGFLLLLVFRTNIFEQWALFRRLESHTSLGRIIRRIYDAFQICLRDPRTLAAALGYSLVNHLLLVVACYAIGHALGIQLSFVNYLSMFLVINAFSSVPLTPGGLGTREGATIYLLGVLNVPAAPAFTLSLLIYGMMLFWSTVGGAVYLAYRSSGNDISVAQDAG